VQINQVHSQIFAVNNYKPLDVEKLQKNIVVIDPAILTYRADKISLALGQDVEGLTGTVTGFMPQDNLENSTTGDLSWISSVTPESPEGEYEVTGQGLTSDNYDFVQHEDNKFALALTSPFNTVIQTKRPPPVDPEDETEETTGNNTPVVDAPPTELPPKDNTVAQNLTPDNGSNKLPPNTNITPILPRVDNKNNNGNQEGKTDKLAVIPTINDLQADQPAKINSLPSANAKAQNAATRLSSLKEDFWFFDCLFTLNGQGKTIRCEPVSPKKSPSIDIKKYPSRKLSALNGPLLP
jgi:hypothetical protein